MNSLEKICLFNVARNAYRYRISDFKGFHSIGFIALNVYILRQLVSYLSAYHLNRLHDFFDEAGIVEVQRVWKRYYALHWKDDVRETIFYSYKVCVSAIEARRVYLENLFHTIVINLDSITHKLTCSKPIIIFQRLPRCRHGACFQCVDSSELDSQVLQNELPMYAEHVQVLEVLAKSPVVQYLLKESKLLKILQRTVRRLEVHSINTDNFTATLELIRMLVQEGSVEEIFLFNVEVSTELLERLMSLVSGQSDGRALGSQSDLVECPVVEVEKNRLLEDNACQWTDGTEIGSCRIAGYENDGLDNLHMTVMNDKSENSDNPLAIKSVDDESETADMNRRFSLACEVSVGESGFDYPGHPVEFDCESYPHVDLGFPSLCSVSSLRSCTSFTLVRCNVDDTSLPIQTILARVLRNWPALRKLALIRVLQRECCIGCSNRVDQPANLDGVDSCAVCQLRREGTEDLRAFLYRSIESNQLTHFVSCNTVLGINIFDVVTRALLAKQRNEPLQELTIMSDYLNDEHNFQVLANSTDGFFGTVCLNLTVGYFEEEATSRESEIITSWIRRDRALRSLHLPIFSDFTYVLQVLLCTCNQRLEELEADVNAFDVTSVSLLVSALKTCPVLRKLSLVDCTLSENNIDRTSFVDAISTHPSLTELNLEKNRLKDVGCDLLKAICLQNKFFNYLNLNYNGIEGQLIFKTCQEIQNELGKQGRSRFPLSELYISVSDLYDEWKNPLHQMLNDCIDVFVLSDLES